MLEVKGLTKKYGRVLANDDISFAAPGGKITVMLGPNGAGKSTAIKAIAGLLRFGGSITIDGYGNKSMEAKRILGYIPETPAVYGLLTVEEHMEFIARAYALSEYEPYAEELMERFELADKKKKLGKELSKGMQQKVSICCALLTRPRLLLVDEPMVGLDPHAIKALKQIFAEEREGGAAVLISTHLLESVEDLWDDALILVHGKIAAQREREKMGAQESLSELFFSITEGTGAGAADAGAVDAGGATR